MTSPRPLLRGFYAGCMALSALLTATGQHRLLFTGLDALQVPEAGISILTGVAHLSWHELAFVTGGFLKSPLLFTALPLCGSATGLLSAILQLTPWRVRDRAVRIHLLLAIGLGAVSLLILGIRWFRGYPDPWRVGTAIAFCVTCIGWIYSFSRGGQRGH